MTIDRGKLVGYLDDHIKLPPRGGGVIEAFERLRDHVLDGVFDPDPILDAEAKDPTRRIVHGWNDPNARHMAAHCDGESGQVVLKSSDGKAAQYSEPYPDCGCDLHRPECDSYVGVEEHFELPDDSSEPGSSDGHDHSDGYPDHVHAVDEPIVGQDPAPEACCGPDGCRCGDEYPNDMSQY